MKLLPLAALAIFGKLFLGSQFSDAPLTSYDLVGLAISYCILDEAFVSIRHWWEARGGLHQWPTPSGPYYDRWMKLKDTEEPDYYIWLANQKQWREPWATWAKQDPESWELWTSRRFVAAGFSWESGTAIKGWVSRDPENGDWILWNEEHQRMLRSEDINGPWLPSRETMEQCLNLGRRYEEFGVIGIAGSPKKDS